MGSFYLVYLKGIEWRTQARDDLGEPGPKKFLAKSYFRDSRPFDPPGSQIKKVPLVGTFLFVISLESNAGTSFLTNLVRPVPKRFLLKFTEEIPAVTSQGFLLHLQIE